MTYRRMTLWLLLTAALATWLTIVIGAQARAAGGCDVILHRGLTVSGEENQPEGVTRATEYGWAEVDATVLEDESIVGIHDKRLGRLTDGAFNGYANEITLPELRELPHPFGKFRTTVSMIRRAADLNTPLMITINHWSRIGEKGGTTLRNHVLDTLFEASQDHPDPMSVYFGGAGAQDAMRQRHPEASTFVRYEGTDTAAGILANVIDEGVDLVALPPAHYDTELVDSLEVEGALVATRQIKGIERAQAAVAAGIFIVQGNHPRLIANKWC